jgi:hypothetical protein
MDEHLLKLFQYQVRSQCEFAILALNDLDEAVADLNRASEQLFETGLSRDARAQARGAVALTGARIWFSLNAILTATANVSKLLWPVGHRKTASDFPDRGEKLRASLGVTDDSPLQHRTVRNHFEHIDERYEEWWLKSERHNIAIRNIGPLGRTVTGLEEAETFEHFDPSAGLVTFQGDVFELRPIADGLTTLHEAARAATADLFPDWAETGRNPATSEASPPPPDTPGNEETPQ